MMSRYWTVFLLGGSLTTIALVEFARECTLPQASYYLLDEFGEQLQGLWLANPGQPDLIVDNTKIQIFKRRSTDV